jgi:putative intracellular protease/amidase
VAHRYLWFWALQALVTYVRAAAEHGGETVTAICERVASRYGVQLAVAT